LPSSHGKPGQRQGFVQGDVDIQKDESSVSETMGNRPRAPIHARCRYMHFTHYVYTRTNRIGIEMTKAKRIVTTAGNLVRQFSHYSDVALAEPVIVTRNGRPRNVLISVEEYERLKKRNQEAFMAADAPDELVADLKSYLRGKKR
jgi:prevent-host-death family protein